MNQILDFLFYMIILYDVSFSLFFYKTKPKFHNSGGRVMFLKWGEKNLATANRVAPDQTASEAV